MSVRVRPSPGVLSPSDNGNGDAGIVKGLRPWQPSTRMPLGAPVVSVRTRTPHTRKVIYTYHPQHNA